MTKKKEQPIDIPSYEVGVDSGLPDVEYTIVNDYASPANESRYGVSFSLPLGVLVALIDPAHDLADTESAVRLGLLGSGGSLSPIGKLVAGGFDTTAVGHKMSAAWRIAHNAPIDKKNGLK